MNILRPAITAAVALLAAWTSVAAHPDVDAARAAVNQGDFRLALTKLKRAEESPSKTEDEVVEMHWYRGFCLHVLGKKAEAAQAFDALLELRPLYRPDEYETPPDLQEAFKKRGESWRKDNGVEFGRPVVQGDSLLIPIARRAERVTGVAVFLRPRGAAVYKTVLVQPEGDVATVRLREGELREWIGQAATIEVVLEARMRNGVPCARVADAARPLAVQLIAAAPGVPAAAAPPGPVAAAPAPSPAPAPARPAPAPIPARPAPATTPPAKQPPTERVPKQAPVAAAPKPAPAPAKAAPGETAPAPEKPARPAAMLYGGIGAGVATGLSALLTVGSLVVALGSAALFASAVYAITSVTGIMASPQYPAWVALYQSMPFAAGVAGMSTGLLLLCTTGLAAVAAVLLWLAWRPAPAE